MSLLPAVEQTFTINASAFLDGIDAMLDSVTKLAEQLNVVVDANTRLSGSNDDAAETVDALSDSVDAAAGSADRLSGATDGVVAAQDAAMAAISANADAVERQSIAVQALVAQSRELVAATDEASGAIDIENASLDKQIAAADTDKGALEGLGASSKIAFLALAAAVGYSVVKAGEFQSAMEKLHTQAGVSQKDIGGLSHQVLALAGQVGENPDSLSEALYHIESNFESLGITGPKAMSMLRVAAEGAQVGGADLVDVTNALTASVASGIPGVQNMQQAMGQLNSIVGAGDMQMQDLADAFGTGMLAAVKGYGLSLSDVGAALDVFGDNNIRGAKAGTDLRMSVQALADPVDTATSTLKRLGMTSTTLRKEMEHGGLAGALDLLQAKFKAAGVTAKEQGGVITDLFGKRAGVGLAILMDQMDRFKSKYPALEKGAHDFGAAWKATEKTFSQQWHDMLSGVEALVTSFGEKLLPAVTKVMGGLAKFFGWLEKNPMLAVFAGGVIAIFSALKLLAGAEALIGGVSAAIRSIGEAADASVPEVTGLDVALDSNVIAVVLIAVLALAAGLYELYKHCKIVREAVADVADFFKAAWSEAMKAAGAVVTWFVHGPLAFIKQEIAAFRQFWAQNGAEIEKIWTVVWDIIKTIITTYWDVIEGDLKAGLDILVGVFKAAWALISGIFETAWKIIANTVKYGIQMVMDVIDIVLDLIQGHWSKAWDALKNLFASAWHLVAGDISALLHGFVSTLFNIGKDLISGLINGIKSMFGSVVGIVKNIAGGVVNTFKSVLKIFSPSQVMAEIGQMLGKGLIQGLDSTASEIKDTCKDLADEIASAVGEGAISSTQGTSISDYIARDNNKLQALANKRATILATMKTAEKYATSTESSVMSWASVSNIASNLGTGGALSGAGLLAGLQGDLSTIKQFNAAIKKLASLGLNKNILNQIVQAGPTDGLAYAQALLDGPVSTIKQINTTESQITTASTQIGKTAADSMYDSGKDVGKGFLSGLKGQEKAIENEMKHLAETMINTIRKELGISSPSKVGIYHGEMFAQGLAKGMTDNEHLLVSASGKLADAMSVNSKGSAGSLAGGGSGSTSNTFHFSVSVPGGFIGNDAQFLSKLAPVIQKAIIQQQDRNSTQQLQRTR